MMLKRLLFLFLAVWFSGCTTMGEKHKLYEFERTEKAYRKLLSRSDMEAALRLVDQDWYRNHPLDLKALKPFQVTYCAVKNVAVSENKLLVTQILEIHYYRTDQYIEKTMQFQQKWRYNGEIGAWMVQNGLPPFK